MRLIEEPAIYKRASGNANLQWLILYGEFKTHLIYQRLSSLMAETVDPADLKPI